MCGDNRELRTHQEHLEELVMERTAELSKVNRELQAEIAERKRAEEELSKSEKKFLTVFHAVPALLAITTVAEGRIIDVNETCMRVLGYQREEMIGRTSMELGIWKSEADRNTVLRLIEEQKRSRDIEINLRSKTGESFVGLMAGEFIYVDGERYVLAMINDITERKRAEEAVRKSEKKFLTVFHAVPALLGITTLAEGRIIDVNETWMRILGYQREEMIGRTSLELGIWKSETDRDRMLRAMEEQGMSHDIEINLKGKTGESFVGLMSGVFIDIDGERYVLSMINDITERKRAEMELEAANRELETFNYSVSHDLRKPLTVINAYCQAIRELCSGKLDEKCREYLQEAYNGTLRMNRLIDTLLNFSRLTHIEPRRETADLSGVAQALAKELQLAEPARRVAFRITEGITADCDAALLQVVLDNLLGNAWKYTGTRDEGIIEFGATEVEGKPAYFVQDNGIGFDMADADRLFTPFQRLPGAEKSKGYGIGLATVERIIRRHGGRIWAEGEKGKGAAFYFTLSD